ncbi:alkaline shock response membrane anchor protein AmaP [Verrucomicrobiota bacterium]
MKILHGFIGFVFWLIILAWAALLVSSWWGLESPVARSLLDNPMDQLFLGAFLILLVLLYALSAIPVRKEERFVSYECDGGLVSVSVKAINSMLSKLGDEFAGIISLRASVATRDKSVRLDMTVKSGAKVQELSQALQQRVRESMQDSLGIAEVGMVRVFVQEIILADDSSVKDRDEQGEWQNIPI